MEEIAKNISIVSNKKTIEILYRIVYPYSKFIGDYASACIAINRELRKLCKLERRDLLVVIGRAVDVEVNPQDTTKEICNKIIQNIIDVCLSLDPDTSGRVAIALGLKVLPHTKVDPDFPYELDPEYRHFGFKVPIIVSDNMKNFLAEANLGPSDPDDPNSTPLREVLGVGQNGVTTRALLIPIFNIYVHVNKMQKDPNNKQYLTATPLMYEYFQDTFDRLAARPQKYTRPDMEGVRKPIPKFDPNRFRYAGLQMIISDNTIKRDDLSPGQKILLGIDAKTEVDKAIADRTKLRLEQEQNLVSAISKLYRAKI